MSTYKNKDHKENKIKLLIKSSRFNCGNNMDLHSYAKRRNIKKWSLEHKRKLVDARISCDSMFENHAETSLEPWKKFIKLSNLDDYNVLFVREQWLKMVDKYKQHKISRLGNLPTKAIDENMLRRITEEWEFFEPLHQFMTHKTTDLHSYALKEPNQADAPRAAGKRARRARKLNVMTNGKVLQKISASASSSSERLNALCSSDTNEDYAAAVGIRNDHDFYSKNPIAKTEGAQELDGLILSYFADGSEDTQESNLNDFKLDAVTLPHHMEMDDDAAVELQMPLCVREEVAETTMPNADTLDSITIGKQQQHRAGTPVHMVDKQQRHANKQQETVATPTATGRTKLRSKPNKKYTNCNNCFKSNPRRSVKGTNVSGGTKQQLGAAAAASQCREHYYRHKRRYHHRQERRFDALLNVFGQIVRTEYPQLDVSALAAMADHVSASSDEEA